MTGDLFNIVRVLDVVLYGGIVSGVIMHWRALRIESLPQFRWGLLGLLLALTYRTGEAVVVARAGGLSLLFITPPLLVLFVSCYWVTVRTWLEHRRQGDA